MTHGYTDSQRMELRSHVNLAGEVVARLWPMRTFISRNPLQGLEGLPFHEAVQRGEQLFGGPGYLPADWYRGAYRDGRIPASYVEQALQPLALDKRVYFGDRVLSHLDVLVAALVHGITLPAGDATPAINEELLARWRPWAKLVIPAPRDASDEPLRRILEEGLSREKLAQWCDRTFGTDLTGQMNRQMTKWCAAFCDEGEAAWSMPHRDQGFFRSWKAAALYDSSFRLMGIRRAAAKISALGDRPEDALLDSLAFLKIPITAWQHYLSLHLAALPGWAGFIKWRAEQTGHPWQDAFRIDLVKYLAVRLFYERELVAASCEEHLGCAGHFEALQSYARQYPYALWFRRALLSGALPKQASAEAARLTRRPKAGDAAAWNETGLRWYSTTRQEREQQRLAEHLQVLSKLAQALGMEPQILTDTAPSDVATVLEWIRAFPLRMQELKWLEASELAADAQLLNRLTVDANSSHAPAPVASSRPLAQYVLCIDVRSEVLRRHIERRGGYETFGFAGFFGLPVSFRGLDGGPEAALCPVLLKPKHVIREVPRTYDGQTARRRKATAQVAQIGQELLHDLKHNVVTPYVMVEALGWFFTAPLLGKTLLPRWYHALAQRVRQVVMPRVATTVTVDKLTAAEAAAMVAAEQRMRLQQWLREQLHLDGALLTPDVLEQIRQQALEHRMIESTGANADSLSAVAPGALGRLLGVGIADEAPLLEKVRQTCGMTDREVSARMERLTRVGLTLTEQAYYVETALRLMGFTSSFARLVFLCGHGSTSQNNPYESALDCGACGGSQGLPNARTFATIANRPEVRKLLASRGLVIPSDTHFLAAIHDTTTDRLEVEDLEDVPATHRKELAQVLDDLEMARSAAAVERIERLNRHTPTHNHALAQQLVEQRSTDWAEVRPEWGLANNAWFIIGGRDLSRDRSMEGRSFLHSYDYAIDPDGKLLEVIMTAPLIVAQWINSEYYFSTVAPQVYGSGSKVYHNVTGRIGVMTGNQSDLRMGLPIQSVMDGTRPYHEPLRLTAIIEAPPDRIAAIIARQPLLQTLFHHQWLRLVALDPAHSAFLRYTPSGKWKPIASGRITADMERPIHA